MSLELSENSAKKIDQTPKSEKERIKEKIEAIRDLQLLSNEEKLTLISLELDVKLVQISISKYSDISILRHYLSQNKYPYYEMPDPKNEHRRIFIVSKTEESMQEYHENILNNNALSILFSETEQQKAKIKKGLQQYAQDLLETKKVVN